ncbi:sodium-dependent serotonin transporter [Elysia marginata]|uniref:Sodium-dependent serotonin transporter n=1 Tax=Elysia marginata TaxID=1093978 RepID=A0AAV4HP08_9GAST|nr:sodium-dependent serotonin transporter [Elysia marginata]
MEWKQMNLGRKGAWSESYLSMSIFSHLEKLFRHIFLTSRAFLFVYVVLTYCVGLPIVYLEISLGQYSRGGVVTAWRIMPLARGIAVSSLFLTLAVVSHSLTPAAWALYYLYSAIAGWLPMEHIPPTLINATNSDSEFVAELTSSNVSVFFRRPSYNISHTHF